MGPSMPKDQFTIAHFAGAWRISSLHGHQGPFFTRVDAVREAVIFAREVSRGGRAVEILVYDGTEPYPVWSSERDGYISSK